MSFSLRQTQEARNTLSELRAEAEQAQKTRLAQGRTKASKQEGLYKQVTKALKLLSTNPRHPGLKTHEFNSLDNPYDSTQKVFEAYAQQNTPGAYRIFWCYGPNSGEITILAITPHP
ncbi:MAG: hypothetical protein GPI96_01320 [Microcystis aeruginosa BS13-02]|nr:hypothetical protein [Microcystis aeruginosa BS13-02]